jgi:hypothetical protein
MAVQRPHIPLPVRALLDDLAESRMFPDGQIHEHECDAYAEGNRSPVKGSRGRSARAPRVHAWGSLGAPGGYDTLVTVGVSLTGPVAIWSSSTGEADLHARYEKPRGGASFPVTEPAARPAVAIATYVDSTAPRSVAVVRALPVAHPLVDVLADGSFLVVGARCRWKKAGPELNALAISQNGQVVRRGCLGDGIQHLQVAPDGTIWAGYFDEGVFGKFGWGRPGPTPLGAGGIAAWSPEFAKVWELDPQDGLVADCYSLNVAGDEVLSCPYTDFPVVRIREHEVRVVPTQGVSGPTGLVTNGDEVALIGTYKDPSLFVRGVIQPSSRPTACTFGRPMARRCRWLGCTAEAWLPTSSRAVTGSVST